MVFGIRGNINKDGIALVAKTLIKSLEKKKIKYIIENELAKHLTDEIKYKPAKEKIVNPKQLVKQSDFIVSIGGDGTFLATAKLVDESGIPIIGVNMGKLGYLAETHIDKISCFISEIIEGKYRVEERTVLEAISDVNVKPIYGMNEIVINQTGIVKTVFIQIYYNESLVISYHADGLIISTPTGSTGYSLSAGGPIVSPGSHVVVICPICPHTLTARPIILPEKGIINVKIDYKVPIIVTADGNSSFTLNRNASVQIKKADYNIKIVKALDSNYFKILNQKLLWGEDKRIQK